MALSFDDLSYKDWYRDKDGNLKCDTTGKRKYKKKTYPVTERRTYTDKERKGLLDAATRYKSYRLAKTFFENYGYGELKESIWDIIIIVKNKYGKEGLEYLLSGGHSVADVKREMKSRYPKGMPFAPGPLHKK